MREGIHLALFSRCRAQSARYMRWALSAILVGAFTSDSYRVVMNAVGRVVREATGATSSRATEYYSLHISHKSERNPYLEKI